MSSYALGRGDGLAGGGSTRTPTAISPRNISPHRLSPPMLSEIDVSPATKKSNQNLGLTRVRAHGVENGAATHALSWGWWHWTGNAWVWCWQHATHQEHLPAWQAPPSAFAFTRPPYLSDNYFWPDQHGALRDANGNLPSTPAKSVAVPGIEARRGHWQQTPLGQWFFVPRGLSNHDALARTPRQKLGGCGC